MTKTITSEIALKQLLEDLKKSPFDLDLINEIAISYFENCNSKSDKEDYDYFQKAYNLKKTVKSTHNFAWFLYFEWSEIEWRWEEDSAIEKALKVQKECIELEPKSFFPYYQYGYMLLDQKRYREAIKYLEKANHIESHRGIIHNLGFCHFQLQDYQEAFKQFEKASKMDDIENRSLFNLAVTAFQLQDLRQLKSIAQKLYETIETNHKTVGGYEIGFLFYLLNDYHYATKSLEKQGLEFIDLFDWEALSYSLYTVNKEKWEAQIRKSITKKLNWITEIKDGHEDWMDYTEKQKQERLIELKNEINTRKKVLLHGIETPTVNLFQSVYVEYCGCLLFGCKQHGNRKMIK